MSIKHLGQDVLASRFIPDTGPLGYYPSVSGETTITNYAYPVGHVKRYGAVGDGSTDDAGAIQRALDSAKGIFVALGTPITIYFPAGIYLVKTSLNGTGGNARHITIKGDGIRSSVISGTAAIGNYPIFDATAADGLMFDDISILTNAADTCYIGLLQSRSGAGSSGLHAHTKLEVYGKFTKSCVYTISAEEQMFFLCDVENTQTGGRSLTIIDQPEAGIASAYLAFGTIIGGNTVQRIIGGRYIANYAGGATTQRAIYIKNARTVSLLNPYINAGNVSSDAAIEIVSCTGITLDTLVVEGSPGAAVLLDGSCYGVRVEGGYFGTAAANRGVRVAATGTVDQLVIRQSTGSGTYLLETLAGSTLTNSDVNFGTRAGILAGTSKNNVFRLDGTGGNTVAVTGSTTNDWLVTDGAFTALTVTTLNSTTINGTTLNAATINATGRTTSAEFLTSRTTPSIPTATATVIHDPTGFGQAVLAIVFVTCQGSPFNGYVVLGWDVVNAIMMTSYSSSASFTFSIVSNKLNITHTLGSTTVFDVRVLRLA